MNITIISFVVGLLLANAFTQTAQVYAIPFRQSSVDDLQAARELLRRGNFSGAREAARKALEHDAKSAEAAYLIGASELALGQLDEARSHFNEALGLAPQYLEARRGVGAIYLKQKRYAEAAVEFSLALKIKPDDFIALYSLGLSHLLQDQAPQAIEHFDKAYRVNPNEASLLAAMLQAHIKLKQRARAEKTLADIMRLLDVRDPRRLQIAFLLSTEGFYDLAIGEFEALRSIYPDSPQLSFNLALAYHRLRRDAEAAKVLQETLAGRDEASLFNLYAEVQEALRAPAQAVAAYRRAAELEPQNEDYLFDYAQSLVDAGSLDESLKLFAKATELFPNSTRMRLGLGAAQYVKGDYERAVDTFLQAAQLSPRAPEVYELLGRAYDAAGPQQSTIERQFSEYLKTQIRDARAEFFYGKILAARARQEASPAKLAEAQQHLEKAIALSETLPESHLELGNLLLEKNQLAAARIHLEKAASLAPLNPDVFYRLSRLYARTGERERAQEALRRFQQLKAKQQGENQKRNDMMKYLNNEPH